MKENEVFSPPHEANSVVMSPVGIEVVDGFSRAQVLHAHNTSTLDGCGPYLCSYIFMLLNEQSCVAGIPSVLFSMMNVLCTAIGHDCPTVYMESPLFKEEPDT